MNALMSREEKVRILKGLWGNVCFGYCKKPFKSDDDITLDHWKPQSWCRANGWTEDEINDTSNLRLMCKPCNARKGDLLPVDDTTMPVRVVETQRDRKANRGPRPDDCGLCFNGRILNIGEICPDCNSGPQPATAPRSTQLQPKDCPHEGIWHCWMCFIGHVPRKSALMTLIEE
jgi:hypothetical protein